MSMPSRSVSIVTLSPVRLSQPVTRMAKVSAVAIVISRSSTLRHSFECDGLVPSGRAERSFQSAACGWPDSTFENRNPVQQFVTAHQPAAVSCGADDGNLREFSAQMRLL